MARTVPKLQPSDRQTRNLYPARHAHGSPLKVTVQAPVEPFWQQWLTALAISVLVLGVLGVPAWRDQKVQRVFAIQANDLSASGLARWHIAQQHCQAQIRQLKRGDRLMRIHFADRSEIVGDRSIQNPVKLASQCDELQPKQHPVPPELGTNSGTSPQQLFNQLITEIESIRTQGITVPVVITIWLQAAEPVPNQPQLDLHQLQKQVQKITDNRGVIAIMGVTGELQVSLRSTLKGNSSVRICTPQDVDECVVWAYETGRKLPAIATMSTPTALQ